MKHQTTASYAPAVANEKPWVRFTNWVTAMVAASDYDEQVALFAEARTLRKQVTTLSNRVKALENTSS